MQGARLGPMWVYLLVWYHVVRQMAMGTTYSSTPRRRGRGEGGGGERRVEWGRETGEEG